MSKSERSYSMEIEGLPPKKDGANSMWGKSSEVPRLSELRRETVKKLEGDPPLEQDISITIEVHVGPVNTKATGDLDTFVAGICDGLQAAHPNSALHPAWREEEHRPVQPATCIGIKDDAQVVSIQAKKIIGDTAEPWYLLQISGH